MLDKVDWTTLGAYMKSLTNTRLCTLIKIMHGWQNTGLQKCKFHLSKLAQKQPQETQPQLDKDELQALSACSANCREKEIQLHYVQCKHPLMMQSQLEERRLIRAKLDQEMKA